jgi:glycosyltransferase involved in cell wall biosynthesis
MAIHEALARRRPVIAAYTNPIRADYVRGESFSPFIATGGSGAELAAHAQRLLADPYLRGDVAERGWQHVRELSWEKTADAYLNLWLTHAPARTRPQGWMDRVQFARKLWREVEPGRSMTPAGT